MAGKTGQRCERDRYLLALAFNQDWIRLIIISHYFCHSTFSPKIHSRPAKAGINDSNHYFVISLIIHGFQQQSGVILQMILMILRRAFEVEIMLEFPAKAA